MKRVLLVSALLVAAGAPALAADLPVKARAPMAPVAEVYNWTGFYIGLNGGYSWGRSRSDVTYRNLATGAAIVPPPGSLTSANFNLDGGVFGGQIGYNWQSGAFVFGLETDAQWSGEKGSANFLCASVAPAGGPCYGTQTFLPAGSPGTALAVDQSIEWFGTFRARVGVLATPSVLLYGTGGLAYGSVKTSGTLTSSAAVNGALTTVAFSNSSIHVGWTAGGGIEAKLWSPNWTGKLEYLYMDLGSFDSTVALVAPNVSATISSRVTDHIFRAGINYQFSPGPVVARY